MGKRRTNYYLGKTSFTPLFVQQATESVRKDLKEMNVDSMIILGGCTKYIQVPDVCWNKPFKERMTELYGQWLSEGVYQFTKGENMKPPSRKRIIEWVLGTWSQLSKENIIKSFKYCGLKLANNGTKLEGKS